MRKVTQDICQHILLVVILSLAFAGFTARTGKAQADAAITPQAQQVIELMRERKRAYLQSDAQAWGSHVAEQCSFIQAGGRLLTKAQFIAEMGPFVGYTFSAVISEVRAAELETLSS